MAVVVCVCVFYSISSLKTFLHYPCYRSVRRHNLLHKKKITIKTIPCTLSRLTTSEHSNVNIFTCKRQAISIAANTHTHTRFPISHSVRLFHCRFCNLSRATTKNKTKWEKKNIITLRERRRMCGIRLYFEMPYGETVSVSFRISKYSKYLCAIHVHYYAFRLWSVTIQHVCMCTRISLFASYGIVRHSHRVRRPCKGGRGIVVSISFVSAFFCALCLLNHLLLTTTTFRKGIFEEKATHHHSRNIKHYSTLCE